MTGRQRAVYWAPALAWIALIFVWSTDFGSADRSGELLRRALHWLVPDLAESLSQEQLRLLNHVVRKTGHLVEYFLLACLTVRALQAGRQVLSLRALFLGALIAAAVASVDELYQGLMPTRSPALRDVILDIAGASAGCAACAAFFWLKQAERRLLAEAASD